MGPPNVGLGGYYFLTPLKHLENMIFYIFSLWGGELNPLMVHRGLLGPRVDLVLVLYECIDRETQPM